MISLRFASGLSTLLLLLPLGAVARGQQADARPWMDVSLPAEKRAELVLGQMTLAEKIALLHGNGMAHAAQWQMPLTTQSNGGAGMVEGVSTPRHSAAVSFRRGLRRAQQQRERPLLHRAAI